MEQLEPVGLITESKIKQDYLDKFAANLPPTENYYVYISKRHGNGAGHYKINKIETNNNEIKLVISFVIKPLEIGGAVMNPRILFFKVKHDCKITEIIFSAQLPK